MAGSQDPNENPVAINVVPMVDVIFCLCIFFMCSFHFKQLQGKIDTWLPKDRGIFQGQSSSQMIREEICVVLRVAPGTGETVRNLRTHPPAASDEDLMGAVLQLADGYNKAGNTTYPLVIDAAAEVPWQDVMHVMDLCKRNNIERIEFAAPERAIEN